MKKEYETVWEIFNECANNQMRDVFFDEIETDDPEAYIRQKFPDKTSATAIANANGRISDLVGPRILRSSRSLSVIWGTAFPL